MPHISKYKLKEGELNKIYKELLTAFSQAFSGDKKYNFAREFFTKTEQVMFAKRFAIIAMLKKDVPPYHIQQVLKVSSSTVARMSFLIEKGWFKTIIKYTNKQNKTIFDILEKILSAGLPPKVGKGRWKRFYELANK